jgi:probable HAF family extracellular repeat protein
MAALVTSGIVHAGKPAKSGAGGGGDSAALYTLSDLGGFTGGSFVQSWALSLNDPDSSGLLQVVGLSYINRDEHAALWDVTAAGQVLGITDIGPPEYAQSQARKINNLGQALVGGYVWVPGQGLRTLPGIDGGVGFPAAINGAGDVAGTVDDAEGNEHGALWHIMADGEIDGPVVFDLGEGNFLVRDMNNSRLMAGSVSTDSGARAAVAFVDGNGALQVLEIGLLPGDSSSQALAINNHGAVVGESYETVVGTDGLPGRVPHGFLWTPSGGMAPLGDLGGRGSSPYDINDAGQIVGETRTNYGWQLQVGFLWQDGVMLDLNLITDTGGGKRHLQIANAINNAGHIAGLLTLGKPVSEQHGFLLVPKP